jgi:colanic acid biosynthesis glycosyl transferase WcaI
MQRSEANEVKPRASAPEKLRILFLSQYFWPEDFRSNDIVVGLKERGCEVTVVTGLPNYPKGKFFTGYGVTRGPYTERWNGVRVVRIPMLARGQANPIKLALNYLSFATVGSLIVPFRLPRREFDVVLCWMVSPITQVLPAIVAKKFTRTPLVLWVMDLWPDSLSASGQVKNRHIVSLAGRLTRWIYRRCDLILGQSRRFAEHIAGVGGFAAKRVGYMPQWEPNQAPQAGGAIPAMPPGFKVIFTGNIGFSQDFETIIAAADLLRDDPRIQWHIVGDGHALPRAFTSGAATRQKRLPRSMRPPMSCSPLCARKNRSRAPSRRRSRRT